MATARYDRVYRIGRKLLGPLAHYLWGFEAPRVDLPEGPCLIISNHTYDFDFVILALAFPRLMHFVVGETLLRNKRLRALINWLHSPVIIRKGATDIRAVRDIMGRLRRGQSVCLFAEGNTTFDGVTCPIPSGTGTLAHACNATLITFGVHGGYFTSPRWGSSRRRGRTWGEVANVYSPQTLSEMDAQSIHSAIQRDIHVDAARDQQLHGDIAYGGKRLAQGLENFLYLCPRCAQMGTLIGKDDVLSCEACGLHVRYTPQGRLVGDELSELKDWATRQRDTLRRLAEVDGFVVADEGQQLLLVDEHHQRLFVASGRLSLSRSGLSIGAFSAPLGDITGMAIYRANHLMFSCGGGIRYELQSDHPRSALKYRDYYELLKQKE